MKCQVHEADLSALLDGELPALEERRVRDHLATCRECRTQYARLQKISSAVREIEAAAEPQRSPEFVDRVVGAIEDRPRRSTVRVARVVRFPSALMAAAALLFMIGLSAAVLTGVLSPVEIRSPAPATDGSAAAVLARAEAIRDAAAGLADRPEIDFHPLALTDLGEFGPDLPDPALFRAGRDPLTGDDLYRSLGLVREGERWLSKNAYRLIRDHLEEEALLARAAELKSARPEVATVAGGNAVTAWVGALAPGAEVTHASLTLVPLLDGDGETGIELVDLQEALANGFLTIREDRSSARLAAENSDETRHVFIPAGTVLVGGYQDRIITRDTLLPPKTLARLPVLCCEEGRSIGERDAFSASPGLAPADIRAVLLSTRDQDEVWKRIRENLAGLGARNGTSSLRGIFEEGRGAENVKAYARALAKVLEDPRTVGVLAFHHGEFIAGDVFSSHELLEVMAERLTIAYALGSLRRDGEGVVAGTGSGKPGQAVTAGGLGQPGEILAAVGRASFLRTPGAVGGQETEFSGGISGSALIPVAGARPLHVALFPEAVPDEDESDEGANGNSGESGRARPPAPPPPGGGEPPAGAAGRRLDERKAERRAGGNRPREFPPPKRPANPPPGRGPRKEPETDRRIHIPR